MKKNTKKRYYFKGWLQLLLETIAFMLLFLSGSESETIITHLIIASLLILDAFALSKYGRFDN